MAAHGRRVRPPPITSCMPDDLVRAILAHLPYRSIARFRAVCKSWRDHIAALPPPAAVVSVQETDDGGEPLTVVRFKLSSVLHRPVPILPSSLFFAVSFTSALRCSSAVLGSWDGVLCVERRIAETDVEYLLWNPLTGACAAVRGPERHGRLIGAYAHPATARFHLLHVSSSGGRAKTKRYHVLTVGDDGLGCWRRVLHTSAEMARWMQREIEIDHDRRPVRLHGNLHWLGNSSDRLATVVAFDMEREQFRLIEGPNAARPEGTTTRLTVLPGRGHGPGGGAGNLCIFAVTPRAAATTMDMWVLEDYVDTKSWILARRIGVAVVDRGQNLSQMFAMADVVEVLDEGVGADGEEILVHLNGHVAVYSFRREAWRHLRLLPTCWRLMTHKESVVGDQVSFGAAARVLPVTNIDGQGCYCLPREKSEPNN